MRVLAIVDGALELVERPDPEPSGSEVRVRVTATGVNRADLLQRAGRYPAPAGVPADVPGLELAGVVDAVGPRTRRFEVGDRVMGLVGGGAHAELALVPEGELVAVPPSVDDVTAGAACEVFVTAHDALVTQAGLRSGETVLVHAVGSGVGTAAVQLVAALGARTVGTSRTADKLARAEALGCDTTVLVEDPTSDEALAAVRAASAPDVVLDLVGGDYLALDLAVARPKGRIVVVGLLAGARTQADLGLLLAKRLEVRGTVLRSRPAHEKAAAMEAFDRQVVPLLADGRLAPVVDEVLPATEAQRAYDLVASDTTFGKVVLTW
ncbi:MAG: NAD(P)H-quinone oxidoreductase [Actinomycetes bacterium]